MSVILKDHRSIRGLNLLLEYLPQMVAFVAEHASDLKVFVEQAFRNPELIRIIEFIVQTVGRFDVPLPL